MTKITDWNQKNITKKTNENENHYKKITNKKTEKIILTVED